MSCPSRALLALGTIALALVFPAPASADDFPLPGFTKLGDGQRPDVAMDGLGRGHVTWTRDVPGGTVLEYCRLPPSSSQTACQVRRTFDQVAGQPFEAQGPPFVFVDLTAGGDDVIIVLSVSQRLGVPGKAPTYAFLSPDGGATFGERLLSANFRIDQDAAYSNLGQGPKMILALGRDSRGGAGNAYQGMPLAGPPTDNQIVLEEGKFGAGHTISPALAGSIGSPVVVYDRNVEGVLLRGGLNAYALDLWPRRSLPFGYGSRLATLDGKPFLLTGEDDESLAVRPYSLGPDQFGNPIKLADISSGQQALGAYDAYKSSLFAAWRVESAGADALAYSVSKDGGKSFSQPVFLAGGEDVFTQIEIAGNTGNSANFLGYAVFGKTFIGNDNGPVGVVPLPASASGSASASAAGDPVAAATRRARYGLRADRAIGRGGTVVSLVAPRSCVRKGSSVPVGAFVANKRFKLRKRRTKVSRVSFSLAGTQVTDARRPFFRRLSTKRLRKGSSRRVRALIYTKRRGSTKRVATQSFRLRVCR